MRSRIQLAVKATAIDGQDITRLVNVDVTVAKIRVLKLRLTIADWLIRLACWLGGYHVGLQWTETKEE